MCWNTQMVFPDKAYNHMWAFASSGTPQAAAGPGHLRCRPTVEPIKEPLSPTSNHVGALGGNVHRCVFDSWFNLNSKLNAKLPECIAGLLT